MPSTDIESTITFEWLKEVASGVPEIGDGPVGGFEIRLVSGDGYPGGIIVLAVGDML
jgi:hypothetical protein